MRGDPYFDVDARLAKTIKVGERRNLQLVFQAFNLFNHANYGNSFDNLVASLSANHLTSTPNTGLAHANNFINPTSSTLPRAFIGEFGARFTF